MIGNSKSIFGNGLPIIPKMGKGITIVTVDVYGDNKGILIDGVPEMDEYIRKLLPERME